MEEFRKRHTFFYDFTDKELFEVFQISTPEIYEPEQVIIHEGRTGQRMYFIIEGKVQVTKRFAAKSAILEEIGAGESFGEMAFIDRAPRTASVVALEPTHVMALNEAVLRHANPVLSLKLLRALAATISDRLRVTDQRYLTLVEGLEKLSRETGFLRH
jgi:CRP-like cAMP-binding protein